MQRRTDNDVDVERAAAHLTIDRKTEVSSPPIPARIAPNWRATHKHSALKYLQQIPSWLLSLILHLAFMLLLASLVVPYGRQTRLEQLFITFGRSAIQDLSSAPIVVKTPQAREETKQEQEK